MPAAFVRRVQYAGNGGKLGAGGSRLALMAGRLEKLFFDSMMTQWTQDRLFL